jgi:AmmeMemoRadiSam system protein A
METLYIPFESQKRLIELSRRILECFVCGWERQSEDIKDPYLLSSENGAFVTLYKAMELRGCIGTCFPTRPLVETVMEMTRAAASQDYRFPSVSQSELPEIAIDISVLSPLEHIQDPLTLEIGKHGLHVEYREKRGVLLPQVAVEYGWDRKTFLRQVCQKADLPENAWQWPETRVCSFTALTIKEER